MSGSAVASSSSFSSPLSSSSSPSSFLYLPLVTACLFLLMAISSAVAVPVGITQNSKREDTLGAQFPTQMTTTASIKDTRSSFARLLDVSLPLPEDWTFAPEPKTVHRGLYSSSSFSFDFDSASVAPSFSSAPTLTPPVSHTQSPSSILTSLNSVSLSPSTMTSSNSPSPAPEVLSDVSKAPSASPGLQPITETMPVVTIGMDLAGTPEQQASTIAAISSYINQMLRVNVAPSLPAGPVPPPLLVIPDPAEPGQTPTDGGFTNIDDGTAITAPATGMPSPAPTFSPTTSSTNSTESPTSDPIGNDTVPSTASLTIGDRALTPGPIVAETVAGTVIATIRDSTRNNDSGRRRRLISTIRVVTLARLNPSHRFMQLANSNSSLCGGQHSTTTLALENYGDEAAILDLLAAIMNGSAVLPAADNTTDMLDTICAVTTTLTVVPLVPSDEVDDSDRGGLDLKGLSTAVIIGIAMAGSVAMLIIAFFIYRCKRIIIMTVAMSTAAKSSSSMAVMDAPTPPPSPAITTTAS